MNEGVAIVFAVIFVFGSGFFLLLFKELRTHRYWRALVAANDLEAIRALVDGEVERWRTMRPPKGVSAAVWAGVQAMQVLRASGGSVHLSTSAEAEFRVLGSERVQVATALDTAFAVAVRLVEMIFYDVPDYRPGTVRVDVYTTYRDSAGGTEPRPVLSLTADRALAMGLDWANPDPRTIALEFSPTFRLSERGEPLPIALPPENPEGPADAGAGATQEAGEASAAADRAAGLR